MAAISSLLRARTFLIADDLTGACDAAVAFAKRGATTEVTLDWQRPLNPAVEVCALSTGTRDVPVEEAVETLQLAARKAELAGFDQVFKKVDSVFRGNTFHEIGAVMRSLPGHFTVIAPAYPALGRTSVHGVLNVSDITGISSIAVRDGLQATGLRPQCVVAGQDAGKIQRLMLSSRLDANRPVYCDALIQDDLHAIVQAAKGIDARILWVGSAGLAHALAADSIAELPERLPHSEDTEAGIVMIFTGSNHPVTELQIAMLREQDDVLDWNVGATEAGSTEKKTAIVFPVQRGITTEQEISSSTSGFDPQEVSCLFLTGGDTAALVCRALGIESIYLEKEFEPGLPQGVAVGGRFAGKTVLLKSGGFGEAEVLRRIARHFGQRREGV